MLGVVHCQHLSAKVLSPGWGDIGYVNRWTLEITNNSRHYSIPLVVGRRIAQIVFFDTQGTLDSRSYADDGKYQRTADMQALKVQTLSFFCDG